MALSALRRGSRIGRGNTGNGRGSGGGGSSGSGSGGGSSNISGGWCAIGIVN